MTLALSSARTRVGKEAAGGERRGSMPGKIVEDAGEPCTGAVAARAEHCRSQKQAVRAALAILPAEAQDVLARRGALRDAGRVGLGRGHALEASDSIRPEQRGAAQRRGS
jgi:hypothetical protein